MELEISRGTRAPARAMTTLRSRHARRLCVLVMLPLLGCGGTRTADTTGERSAPARYWDLATGSRIAYAHVPAERGAQATVVFVHGGPGASQVVHFERGRQWYERLAGLGFEVYAYDQVGSGLSARLADPRQYTVARHIADLEAIRTAIGARFLVLVGDSWGATLVANYMAAHPGVVTKAIFTSPGAIDPGNWGPHSATPRIAVEMLQWIEASRGRAAAERYHELDGLLQRDIRAAYAFAPDSEMDHLFGAYINEHILPITVADRAKLERERVSLEGMGWWSNVMVSWDVVSRKKPAIPALRSANVPVLILRGSADYLPHDFADEYPRVFARARLVEIPNAGHLLWVDAPEVYAREIENFLLGATVGR